MAARPLRHGDTVRVPSGETGRILKRSRFSGFLEWSEYDRFDLDRRGDVVVYRVLLESGEVRQYSFEALAAANGWAE